MPRPDQAPAESVTYPTRSYAVAISFSGKQASLVRELASRLTDRLLQGEVFFDEDREGDIRGYHATQYLREVFSQRSVLVVKCRSETYGQSPWTKLEIEAINNRRDARECVYEVAADDFIFSDGQGTAIDVLNLSSQMSQVVDEIVDRARLAFNAKRHPFYEQACNPFEAMELINALSTINIGQIELLKAVPKGIPTPSPVPADCWTIGWWINRLRACSRPTLADFVREIWRLMNPQQKRFLEEWFLRVFRKAFEPPSQTGDSPPWIWQFAVMIDPTEAPNRVFDVRSRFWQYSGFEAARYEARVSDEHQIQAHFAQAYREASSKTDVRIERVEIALPYDLLSTRVTDWQIENEGLQDCVCSSYCTVVRSIDRAFRPGMLGARSIRNALVPHFAPRELEKSEWATWESKDAIVVNATNKQETKVELGIVFRKLVFSRAPVAIWFHETDYAWICGSKAQIELCFENSSSLPTAIRRLHLKHAANNNHVVLMFEDDSVPLPVDDNRLSDQALV